MTNEKSVTERSVSTLPVPITASRPPSVFSGEGPFEAAQRMAKALVASSLVPKEYQGNGGIPNAMIALEMAQRVGASPLAVMQNMHVIHGRPSWSSTFIIASLNSCGRFSPLRFEMTGTGDKRTCLAWAYDSTGEKLTGPAASIEMAKAEGWFQKTGSKWKTMPELMLRYRAAAFFGRLYAPDILMGMHSDDEIQDVGKQSVATEAPVLVTEVDEVKTVAVETTTQPTVQATTQATTQKTESDLDREAIKKALDELDIEYSSRAQTKTLNQILLDAVDCESQRLHAEGGHAEADEPPPLVDVGESAQEATAEPATTPKIDLF